MLARARLLTTNGISCGDGVDAGDELVVPVATRWRSAASAALHGASRRHAGDGCRSLRRFGGGVAALESSVVERGRSRAARSRVAEPVKLAPVTHVRGEESRSEEQFARCDSICRMRLRRILKQNVRRQIQAPHRRRRRKRRVSKKQNVDIQNEIEKLHDKLPRQKDCLPFGGARMHSVARISCRDVKMFFCCIAMCKAKD